MNNNIKDISIEVTAKNLSQKILSIVKNNNSAMLIIKEVILPTVGSEADLKFWEMVSANIG